MNDPQFSRAPGADESKPLPPQVAEAMMAMDNLLEAIILRQAAIDDMRIYARNKGWGRELPPIGELLKTARAAVIEAKRVMQRQG